MPLSHSLSTQSLFYGVVICKKWRKIMLFGKKKQPQKKTRIAERASFILPTGNDSYELTLVMPNNTNNNISLGNPTERGYVISTPIVRFSGDKENLLTINRSGTIVNVTSFDNDYVAFVKHSGDIAYRFALRKETDTDTFLINVSVYRNANATYRIQTQELMGLTPETYYPDDILRFRRSPATIPKPWWENSWWPIQAQDGPFLKINSRWVFINWANPDGGVSKMLEFYKSYNIKMDTFCGDWIKPIIAPI